MQAGLLACLLCLLLIGQGCTSSEIAVPLPRLQDDAVILAFGDSLTHGTGADRSESYPAVLEDLIDRRVVNAGVPGDTTAGGLKRLAAALEKHRPNLVILCLGGNDFLRRKSAAETRANLESMLRQIKAADIPVLFLGVPEIGLSIRTASMYAEMAAGFELSFMQDVITEVLSNGSLKSDPIHPNARGYEKIAREIAQHLVAAGAIPQASVDRL